MWVYRMDMPEVCKHFSKTSKIKREYFFPADELWLNRRDILHEGGTFKSRKYFAEGKHSLDHCGYVHLTDTDA